MPPISWWLTSAAVAAAAFGLRVFAHAGRRATGLDTWYFLAYADAVRRRPGFDVRLPQYLLQDERQSYPPLFPSLLALAPPEWLRRRAWVVSPLLDCVHLLLLAWVTWSAAPSTAVSGILSLAFAFTPQAIAEPRGLNPKSLSSLLYSLAMVLAIECVRTGGAATWLAAVVCGAAIFLASGAMSGAYLATLGWLSVLLLEPRFLWIAIGSLAAAMLSSGGHLIRVVTNYLHAIRFWRRQHTLFGAHPIRHSPVYGNPRIADRPVVFPKGLLGHGKLGQLARLVGDNPYLLILVTPVPPEATAIRAWALGLAGLAVVVTVVPRLRSFGLGRSLIRAAIFPTLYALATVLGQGNGLLTITGVAILACLLVSQAATVVLFKQPRPQVEWDASVSDALQQAARALAGLPAGGVLCLPYVHTGVVGYTSAKPMLWGGHCGDLRRWEALMPVISRPIPELMKLYAVRYLLIDTRYAEPADVGLGDVRLEGRWGSFALWSSRD